MKISIPASPISKTFFHIAVSAIVLSPAYAKTVPTVTSNPPLIVESPVIDLGLEEDIIDSNIQKEPTPITLIHDDPDEEVEEEDIEPLPDIPDELEIPQPSQENVSVPSPKPKVQNGYTYVEIGLPGLDRPLPQKYVTYFQSTEGRKILVQSLKNSTPYRPYIIQSLKKNNLPEYLQYLPIIESEYKTNAVSKSGATGIWQFMTNSMAPLLKKGKGFDDRRDPWSSTDAAMLKFKDNYGFFKDWTMAIAAYNCGAGALLKLKKANPSMDYWDMAENGLLKNETVHYVPKLLAVMEIIENAGYYGLDDIRKAAEQIKGKVPEEFDYVPTKVSLTFQQLSEVTGVSVDKIRQLNLALFKDSTPMGENYKLRLPKGASKGIKEKLKKKGLATDCQYHTVVKGDTLWGISRKYDITVADLCKANGINENSVLSIGKQLVVPIF